MAKIIIPQITDEDLKRELSDFANSIKEYGTIDFFFILIILAFAFLLFVIFINLPFYFGVDSTTPIKLNPFQ